MELLCFRGSGREERGGGEGIGKERRGGGEGGSRVLDILDGHWASVCRIGSVMTLEGDLCSSWSNFVRDVASKMYFFQLKDSIFHQIGPSCWQGPKM